MARKTLHCSARQGVCLAEGREPPGILPSTGTKSPAGLSSAQPCGEELKLGLKEAQTCACCSQACSSFVFTDGSQVPLWMLLLGKKSFRSFPTSSAPKCHSLHASCVSNLSAVPILAAGSIPLLPMGSSQPFCVQVFQLGMLCSDRIWPLAAF